MSKPDAKVGSSRWLALSHAERVAIVVGELATVAKREESRVLRLVRTAAPVGEPLTTTVELPCEVGPCNEYSPCVYAIHTPEGTYIGQTSKGTKERMAGHIGLLRKGKHHAGMLQDVYDRHGWESFRVEIMSGDPTEEAEVALSFKGKLLNAQSFDPVVRAEQIASAVLRNVSDQQLMEEVCQRGLLHE